MAAPAIPIASRPGESRSTINLRRLGPGLGAAAVFVVIAIVLGKPFHSWWDFHVAQTVTDIRNWIVDHRDAHWLFKGVFNPITRVLDNLVHWTENVLRFLSWPGIIVAIAALALRVAGRRVAALCAVCLIVIGVLGLWAEAIVTMSQMIVAVSIALLIGIPIGILSGRHPRFESAIRGLLDVAQVMPAFCYLLLAVLLFDVGAPPLVVATVIFALAPAVRLTSLGIRSVSSQMVEVGHAHGSTERQVLGKVQWPLARPAIVVGTSQVIMMAFGVVVLGAGIGGAGLAGKVQKGLDKINVGVALDAGIAIVLLAVILDRISAGRATEARRAFARRDTEVKRRELLTGLAVVGVAVIAGRLIHGDVFPKAWTYSVQNSVNDFVKWLQRNVRNGVPVVGGTEAFSDFFVRDLIEPMRRLFVETPWFIITGLLGALAWRTAGRRVALVTVLALLAIGGLRLWNDSMDTLSQVILAVVLAVVIALPLGIWSGRSDRFEKAIRPFLDAAQVMPAFVYLVPVVALFNVGRVPGMVASVVYAIPPGIRLISLGLRQVPPQMIEVASASGCTNRQTLRKVQIPLASRAIMLGINQVILMTLSMVVIAGLVGSGGLGLKAVEGYRKANQKIGSGFAAGICIVLLAIMLDRVTQAWGQPRRSTQSTH